MALKRIEFAFMIITRSVFYDKDGDNSLTINDTDNNELLQESSYYPFGLSFAEGNINNSNKYLYNGKELQDDYDLDWLDYGARFYDAELGRWHVADPLSEEYYSMSTYNYVVNNPIILIDPDGRSIHNYGIDGNGKIELLNETKDKYDVLYKVDNFRDKNKQDTNEDGKVNESDGAKVDNRKILPELSKVKEKSTDSYHGELTLRTATVGESGQDDIFNLFLFAANYSNVEWGANRASVDGAEQYSIGTYQNPTLSPGYSKFGVNNDQTISHIHSHPGTSLSEEVGSMYGDKMSAWRYTNARRQIPYNKYIYMPKSGNLWYLNRTNANSEYIRNIKGNYKRLFFGTLNSR